MSLLTKFTPALRRRCRFLMLGVAMAATGLAQAANVTRPPETTRLLLPGAENHVFREAKRDALRTNRGMETRKPLVDPSGSRWQA
jgi:hypothetical protein